MLGVLDCKWLRILRGSGAWEHVNNVTRLGSFRSFLEAPLQDFNAESGPVKIDQNRILILKMLDLKIGAWGFHGAFTQKMITDLPETLTMMMMSDQVAQTAG